MTAPLAASAVRTIGRAFIAWLLIYAASFALMMLFMMVALFGGAGAEALFEGFQYVPTLGLYAVAAWACARLAPPAYGGVALLAGVAATALLPPLIVNLLAERKVAAARSEDGPVAVPDRRPQSIALLVSSRVGDLANGDDGNLCGNYCQRLLYAGAVREVVVGPPPAGFDIARPRRLTAYRIEPRAVCPPVEVPNASSIAGERRSWENPVSTAVRQQVASGRCLVARPVRRLEAEHVWVQGDPDNPDDGYRSREGAGPFLHRFDHYRREGGRYVRIGRHTHVRYSRAIRPFWGRFALGSIWPRFAIRIGEEIEAEPFPSARFVDTFGRWLPRPAGVGAVEAGNQVDRSLASARPGQAQGDQLYWAFIDMLAAKERWDAGDAGRLARIIESPDFHPERHFSIANETLGRAISKSRESSRIVGDAILRRALAADPAGDHRLFRALSDSLAWLPAGTFREPSPLLDRIANDPVRRGRLPRVAYSLNDRGAAGAPLLFRIVNEDLYDERSGADAVVIHGVEGICRLAPRLPGAAGQTRALIARIEQGAGYRHQVERLRDSLRVMQGGSPRRRTIDGRIVESC